MFFVSWAWIPVTQILGMRYSDFMLIRGAPFGAFCVAGVRNFDDGDKYCKLRFTQIFFNSGSPFGVPGRGLGPPL